MQTGICCWMALCCLQDKIQRKGGGWPVCFDHDDISCSATQPDIGYLHSDVEIL
jgi:hypothetical protein